MIKRLCVLVAALAVLVALVIGVAQLDPLRGDAMAASRAKVDVGGPNPTAVVQAFYTWYLDYAVYEGNPLVDRAYRGGSLLTVGLVERVDALLDSFDRGGYDPFLLAQDVPTSVAVSEAVVMGETAEVLVHTSFEGHVLRVTLVQDGDGWRIEAIDPAYR